MQRLCTGLAWEEEVREIAAMSDTEIPLVVTPIPVYGAVTVISPQDQGKVNPQKYHLRESAIVLIWATRQGHNVTAWVRDVLDNVWIIVHDEE